MAQAVQTDIPGAFGQFWPSGPDSDETFPKGGPYPGVGNSDNAYNFQNVLKNAVSAYGIPAKLYVDNGCSYANEQLALICGSIGTVLLHTKIRDGASKGKVGRHFRTRKERWLYALDIESIRSLAQFNGLLADYIRDYNTTHHTGIDGTPFDRYRDTCLCGRNIRVLKFYLPGGELETLITNETGIDADRFHQLYFLRWPVEENHKLIK